MTIAIFSREMKVAYHTENSCIEQKLSYNHV